MSAEHSPDGGNVPLRAIGAPTELGLEHRVADQDDTGSGRHVRKHR
jgi:hypothetical protein